MSFIEKAVDKKVGKFSIGDGFAIGVAKSASELAMLPLVGNGTFTSGLTKGVSAALIGHYGGKVHKYHVDTIASYTATGMFADGVEDVINATLKKLAGVTIDEQSSGLI